MGVEPFFWPRLVHTWHGSHEKNILSQSLWLLSCLFVCLFVCLIVCLFETSKTYTPKTNMTMEHSPFESTHFLCFQCFFFSSSHVSFQGSTWCYRLVFEFWLLHEGRTSVLLKAVQISTLVGLIIPFPQVTIVLVFIFILYLGVGFKYFLIFTPKIGEDFPKLTFAYFFKWIGSPTNQIFFWKDPYDCFLKWWYPQSTLKWSVLVGKPMVVGYQHFRKPSYSHVIIKSSAALFL